MKQIETAAVEAHEEEAPALRIVNSSRDSSNQCPPAPLVLPSRVPPRATRREFVVLGWKARFERLQSQGN